MLILFYELFEYVLSNENPEILNFLENAINIIKIYHLYKKE